MAQRIATWIVSRGFGRLDGIRGPQKNDGVFVREEKYGTKPLNRNIQYPWRVISGNMVKRKGEFEGNHV